MRFINGAISLRYLLFCLLIPSQSFELAMEAASAAASNNLDESIMSIQFSRESKNEVRKLSLILGCITITLQKEKIHLVKI